MGGWGEEVWYSLLQVARLSEGLKSDYAQVIEKYLIAFENRPTRVEPLVDLARFHREQKRYNIALIFARRAIEIKRPPDILFVEAAAYDWRALDELAIASYWTGAYGECAQACDKLLNSVKLPDNQRQRILANRKFALDRLLENDPAANLRARGPLGSTTR
jgi:tetratricopeptide (TPR) repeat protein